MSETEEKSILERQGALLLLLEEARSDMAKINKRLDVIEKKLAEIREK